MCGLPIGSRLGIIHTEKYNSSVPFVLGSRFKLAWCCASHVGGRDTFAPDILTDSSGFGKPLPDTYTLVSAYVCGRAIMCVLGHGDANADLSLYMYTAMSRTTVPVAHFSRRYTTCFH